ncbi:MAG TPA: DUF5996 family protein [Candidatus Saccharimonadia bacterium]|nr:DUF5996 family protein [Candidatus Saccharimonadia bacterium]
MELPELVPKELNPTRDYLQDAAKVIGKLQQAFLPETPRGWQYGIEVMMRGLATQEFELNGRPTRALLDLVRHKLRLGNENWRFRENPPAQLLAEIRAWLKEQGSDAEVAEPELNSGTLEFDHAQGDLYGQALWWMHEQFKELKESLPDGVASPILLYPHHFDLSLAWFPFDKNDSDERQVSVGWSTGDETIPEPYVYVTAYPEPEAFKKLELPPEARWQSDGFSGAVLLHNELAKSSNPEKLFKEFAWPLFSEAKRLLG